MSTLNDNKAAFPTGNNLVEKQGNQDLLRQVFDVLVNSGALNHVVASNTKLETGWGLFQRMLRNIETGLLCGFKEQGRITSGNRLAGRTKSWMAGILMKCKKDHDRLGDGSPLQAVLGSNLYDIYTTTKKAAEDALEAKKAKKLEEDKCMEFWNNEQGIGEYGIGLGQKPPVGKESANLYRFVTPTNAVNNNIGKGKKKTQTRNRISYT